MSPPTNPPNQWTLDFTQVAITVYFDGIMGPRRPGPMGPFVLHENAYMDIDGTVSVQAWSMKRGNFVALYYDTRSGELHVGDWVLGEPRLYARILSELGHPQQDWERTRRWNGLVLMCGPLTLIACLAERSSRPKLGKVVTRKPQGS